MHFTTLYLLKGAKLEDLSIGEIERDFGDRYCYCCGETRPRYRYWCDWFQIGGRWCDIIKAKKGLVGERSWCNKDEEQNKGHFSIVDIQDLEEPIDSESIYAIATKSKIYQSSDDWTGGIPNKDKFNELLNKINNKLINGVVVLIDCHD